MNEVLVSRESLEQVLNDVTELEPYWFYMKARWIGMVMWWHERSVDARRKYFALRAVVVAGGAAIPVLTAVGIATGRNTGTAIAAAIVGAVVAAAAAWEGVANYGDTWREKRRAAELLKVEGYQFIQLCGKYGRFRDGSDKSMIYGRAFPSFATEVEAMIAREVGEYLSGFDPSIERGRDKSAAVGDQVHDESKIARSGETHG
jgi:hypothetical protein